MPGRENHRTARRCRRPTARLHPRRLCQESAAAGDRKIVSHYDATFAVRRSFPGIIVRRGPDPILDGLVRAYGGAFVGYARDEFGFKTDMTYILLASDISGKWDWDEGHGQPSVADDLRVLLALTPSFHLTIAHGYSDMVTPYAVSRYVLNHLPPHRRRRRGRSSSFIAAATCSIWIPDSRKAFTADARANVCNPMICRPMNGCDINPTRQRAALCLDLPDAVNVVSIAMRMGRLPDSPRKAIYGER